MWVLFPHVQRDPQNIELTPAADTSTEGSLDQQHVLERFADTVYTHNQPSALSYNISDLIQHTAILRNIFLDIRQLKCFDFSLCFFLFVCFARLKQLEQEVVGGEQARNKELQQRHRQRKNLADQRKDHLIRALSEDGVESENVLLNVYNSIQEEVYGKSQMLLKVQGKVGRPF